MHPTNHVDHLWRQLQEDDHPLTASRVLLDAVSRTPLPELAASLNRLRPLQIVKTDPNPTFNAICAAHSLIPDAVSTNVWLVRQHAVDRPPLDVFDVLARGEHFARFSLGILEHGQLTATDPWSGETVVSRHCISSPGARYENVPVHAFRFGATKPFFLIFLGLLECRMANLLYVPGDELVFFQGGDPFLEKTVSHWRAFCVRHALAVSNRLRSMDAVKPAVLVGTLHFGHHIWNELSFLELLARSPAASQTTVIAARAPLGSIAAMYPELRVSELPALQELEDVHRDALDAGYLCAPSGRLHIPVTLIERLRTFAGKHCVSAVGEAEAFRQRHSPVLWLSVRSGQRAWLNQGTVLREVLGALLLDYPRLGVIVDGLSWPLDLPSYGADLVGAEQQIARQCVDGVIPSHHTKVLIGTSLLESLVWTNSADAYVAHHGSLHHKIAWFADIPGIVHVSAGTVPAEVDTFLGMVGNTVPPKFGTLLGVVAGLRTVRPTYLFGDVVSEEGPVDGPNYTLNSDTVLSLMRQILAGGHE